MGNNLYERDFSEQGALKRPGRLDFRTLNNVDDAGDGYPGLQKALRNWHWDNLFEIFVEPGESIQDAIDNAETIKDFVVIVLKAGDHGTADTYPITINNTNKSYWIRGEGGDLTKIQDDGTATNIFEATNFSTVIFSDLHFDCTGWDPGTSASCIVVNNSNDNSLYVHRCTAVSGYSKGYGGILVEVQRGCTIVEHCHDVDEWDTLVKITGANVYSVYVMNNHAYGVRELFRIDSGSASIDDIFILNNEVSYYGVLNIGSGNDINNVFIRGNNFGNGSKMTINGVDNLFISDNYFYASDPVELTNCTKVLFSNNFCSAGNNNAVELNTITESTFVGNYIIAAASGGYGIRMVASCRYNTIIGNNFEDMQHAIYQNDTSSTDNIINGNYIKNCADEAMMIYGARTVINGNQVSGTTGHGIALSTGATECSITGNLLFNNSLSGIYLSNISNSNISGNMVYGSVDGIYLTGCSNNTISGNTINANDSDDGNPHAGVILASNCDQNTIAGNTINNNNNAGAGTTYGIYIFESGSADNNVEDNLLFGNDYSIIDNGTRTHIIYKPHTEKELREAVASIGASGGIIILPPGTLTLTSQISIDSAGSVVIQGKGDISVIDCGIDQSCIVISSSASVVLRDFKLDATDIATGSNEAIDIQSGRVLVDNLRIVGNSVGIGINVAAGNCVIRDCTIDNFDYGIDVTSNGNKIIGCTVTNCDDRGIEIDSGKDYNQIINNRVYGNSADGICIYQATYNLVNGNMCYNNGQHGIYVLTASYNEVSGNYCYNNTSGYGIYSSSGQYNTLSGNNCYSNQNGLGCGGNYNTLSGNNCSSNTQSGIAVSGANHVIAGNNCSSNTLRGIYLNSADYCAVTGNTCNANNTSSATDGGGIVISTEADYNTITGNMCYGNTNDTGTAYGIWIDNSNCDDNLVAGNNCQGNETDYTDSGTGTVDDSADQAANDLNRFG